jgi:hypothetical protein
MPEAIVVHNFNPKILRQALFNGKHPDHTPLVLGIE